MSAQTTDYRPISEITSQDLEEMCCCTGEGGYQYSNLESLFGAEVEGLHDAILFFQNLYTLGYDPLGILNKDK